MHAKLLVKPVSGELFEVKIGNTATIGRSHDNTVVLDNPLVSRQHVIIRCHNGQQYQIIDLGSTNGTFVGDQRVVMPRTIEQGEIIRIGGNEIVLLQTEEQHAQDSTLPIIAVRNAEFASAAADVALLVCDIRGFSAAAEKTPTDQLALQLGAWFREVGNVIHATGGVIDKFIGDAVLAYWTKRNLPSECDLALQSARKLLDLARAMTWSASPTGLHVAVALHFGRVACGNIGVDATRDATIIGDTVNIVFRMEALSKQLNSTVICSQDFLARLPASDGFADLGEHELKGKRNTVRVFGLEGV